MTVNLNKATLDKIDRNKLRNFDWKKKSFFIKFKVYI
jgi:hypothetical protein